MRDKLGKHWRRWLTNRFPDNYFKDRQVSAAELLRLLERVNLPAMARGIGGLDVALDWEKPLSIDSQRRLAFARVLLTRPRFAILDAATSALAVSNGEEPLPATG